MGYQDHKARMKEQFSPEAIDRSYYRAMVKTKTIPLDTQEEIDQYDDGGQTILDVLDNYAVRNGDKNLGVDSKDLENFIDGFLECLSVMRDKGDKNIPGECGLKNYHAFISGVEAQLITLRADIKDKA